MCEPANRDLRPSRFGLARSRMSANVMIPASTATANRSSRKPTHAQCPIPGIANVLLKRSPYDSMRVRIRMMKPQNVRKCAVPGTDHCNSLRCPSTSVTSVPASRAGCSLTAWIRSGAGWPVRPSR